MTRIRPLFPHALTGIPDVRSTHAVRIPAAAPADEPAEPHLAGPARRHALRRAATLTLALGFVCGAAAAQPVQRGGRPLGQDVLGDSVVGTVRDAATGRPVTNAPVDGSNGRAFTERPWERPITWTDTAGRFVLRGLRPGRRVITVETRPYLTARAVVVVSGAGRAAPARPPVLRIVLRRGPSPWVSLTGRWAIELIPGATSAAAPTTVRLRGTLTLRDTTGAHGAGRLPDPALFRLALGTFVGTVPPRSGGEVVDAPWTPGRTEEAGGVIFFGDSVVLRIGPRHVTHGDFVVRGRFTGDSARGVWEGVMPADGSGPAGRFVLRRLR